MKTAREHALAAALLACVALLASAQCSLAPRAGSGEAAMIDSERAAAAETTAVTAPQGATVDMAVDTTASRASTDARVDTAGASDLRAPAAGADAERVGRRSDAAVSVDLGGVERTRLASETRRDLAAAERAVAAAKAQPSSADGLDRLRTVEELIAQARAAYQANDIEGASRLARKARLLAADLSRSP